MKKRPSGLFFAQHPIVCRRHLVLRQGGDSPQIDAVLAIPLGAIHLGIDDIEQPLGIQTGDVVLKRVAKLGNQLLEDHGWVCRYGGEELVVLFANPDIHFCQMLLEQYRIGVASLHWREPGLGITFSGGLVASAPGLGARSLLTMVDAEVYRAKGDGKNRIYMVDPLAPRDDSPSGDGMLSKEEA